MKYPLSNNPFLSCFVSPEISSNMYVLIKGEQALVIDPHENLEMQSLLEQNHVKEVTVFLTHEHPDHTSGVPFLAKNYQLKLICQQKCAEAIAEKRNNRPIMIAFIFSKHISTFVHDKRSDKWEYCCKRRTIYPTLEIT